MKHGVDVASFDCQSDPLKIALKSKQQLAAEFLVRLNKIDLTKKITAANMNYFSYALCQGCFSVAALMHT